MDYEFLPVLKVTRLVDNRFRVVPAEQLREHLAFVVGIGSRLSPSSIMINCSEVSYELPRALASRKDKSDFLCIRDPHLLKMSEVVLSDLDFNKNSMALHVYQACANPNHKCTVTQD